MKGALSYPGVRRWAQRFRVGRESVEDDPRAGAPVTAVVPKYSSAIKELLDSDPHITVKELVHIIGISTGSVGHILKSKLNLSKVCARWVLHCLTKACQAKIGLRDQFWLPNLVWRTIFSAVSAERCPYGNDGVPHPSICMYVSPYAAKFEISKI